MKNPPDPFYIVVEMITPLIFYLGSILVIYLRATWYFSTFLIVLGSIVVLGDVYYGIINRPYEVEVGNNIVLHYMFKGTIVRPLNTLQDLLEFREKDERYLSKGTAGTIRFIGDRTVTRLTGEILNEVRQKYHEAFNQDPPLPDWYVRKNMSKGIDNMDGKTFQNLGTPFSYAALLASLFTCK